MELEIIDFDMFPPDALPHRKGLERRRDNPARQSYRREPRRQEAMFFPEAEEAC